EGTVPNWLEPLLFALVGAVVLWALATLLALRWFGRSAEAPRERGGHGAHRAFSWRQRRVDRLVIGYVSTEEAEPIEPDAERIHDACVDRGWVLAQIVHDHTDEDVPALNRPGLTRTLRWLKAGVASRLVVHR